VTDWIEHTTDSCPVDPETVVEVVLQFGASIKAPSPPKPARRFIWTEDGSITHYRIITPAKPPEPEMTKTHEEDEAYLEEARRQADREYSAYKRGFEAATKPEPDLITLRLECMKMAVTLEVAEGRWLSTIEQVADRFLHYVLNGSVDKA
jgi:hypothetical protein